MVIIWAHRLEHWQWEDRCRRIMFERCPDLFGLYIEFSFRGEDDSHVINFQRPQQPDWQQLPWRHKHWSLLCRSQDEAWCLHSPKRSFWSGPKSPWFHWSIWLLLIQTLLQVWWDHPTSVMRWNLCGEIVETRLEFSSRDFSCMVPICGGQAQIGREHRRHCCKMTRDAIFMSYALSTKCLEPVLTVSWWCTIVPRGRSNISLNTTFTVYLTTTIMTLREAGLACIFQIRPSQDNSLWYPLRRLHPQQEEEWSSYKTDNTATFLSSIHARTRSYVNILNSNKHDQSDRRLSAPSQPSSSTVCWHGRGAHCYMLLWNAHIARHELWYTESDYHRMRLAADAERRKRKALSRAQRSSVSFIRNQLSSLGDELGGCRSFSFIQYFSVDTGHRNTYSCWHVNYVM